MTPATLRDGLENGLTSHPVPTGQGGPVKPYHIKSLPEGCAGLILIRLLDNLILNEAELAYLDPYHITFFQEQIFSCPHT